MSYPRRYHDAVLKEECGNLVEDLISNFGKRHGIRSDALTYYVGGIRHDRLFGGDELDKLDTYRPSEEEQSGTDEGEEDENDDEGRR